MDYTELNQLALEWEESEAHKASVYSDQHRAEEDARRQFGNTDAYLEATREVHAAWQKSIIDAKVAYFRVLGALCAMGADKIDFNVFHQLFDRAHQG